MFLFKKKLNLSTQSELFIIICLSFEFFLITLYRFYSKIFLHQNIKKNVRSICNINDACREQERKERERERYGKSCSNIISLI